MTFALGRFAARDTQPFLGLVQDDAVTPVSEVYCGFAQDVSLRNLVQCWDKSFDILNHAVQSGGASGGTPLASLQVLSPLPDPRQIFCAGANYKKHVLEMVVAIGVRPDTDGMSPEERGIYAQNYLERQMATSSPFVFMKPAISIAGPYDTIALPSYSDRVDWELELGVVIGRHTAHISESAALDHVAGYMVVNDITARDQLFRVEPGVIGPDWLSGKGAPGFLPTGPFFVPAAFVDDPHNLRMELAVNDEIMQQDTTGDMIFNISRLMSFISNRSALLPGDLLCSGSPAGNGIVRGQFLQDGDVIRAQIEGLGAQLTPCVRNGGAA